MEDGTDNRQDIPQDKGQYADPVPQPMPEGWEGGLPVPILPPEEGDGPGHPIARWEEREDFLRTCVRVELTAHEISLVSLHTPQPMRNRQRVYDLIESQGLTRLYRSPRIKRRRTGYHNERIIKTFMRLSGQAYGYGYRVSDVIRDQTIEGTRFRPDLGLRLDKRLFYAEIQLSRIEYTRWRAKLSQYVRLYGVSGKPFRVLWLLTDEATVTKVRTYARQVLSVKGHPALNLFLFMSLHRFETEWDILKKPVWMGSWESRDRHALMG